MIEVKNLVKRYGSHLAVEGLSFRVEKGQVYGLLGPNGAGKSTTMNIITGYLSPTEGEILVAGHDIVEESEAAKKSIGYLPESPPLYLDMTAREYIGFVMGLKRVPREARAAESARVMEITGIADVSGKLMRHLSKGYRQRVGIAQALVGDPPIVILDEPTVGLDPKQIIEIRSLIRSLGKKHTVILSSHILSEVSAICDHVLIISHGKLAASDTPENLRRMTEGERTLRITAKGTEQAFDAAIRGISAIRAASYTPSEEKGAICASLTSGPEDDVREAVFYALAAAKCPILAMETVGKSLEDVFLELTADDETPEKEEAHDSDIA